MNDSRLADPEITYAIGDIHGQYGKLVRLLDACAEHGAGRPFRIVCIGDYIDRGPQSNKVVERLISAQQTYADRLVCLRGNHEQLFADAASGISDSFLDNWMSNGGAETLSSYGARHPSEMPPAHVAWLSSRPLRLVSEGRLYVHAGIVPGVALPLQKDNDLIWIREPFLSWEKDHEYFVVHGHTPTRSRKPDLRANRLNIDTGAGWDGPLTAAVFVKGQIGPVAFLTDAGTVEKPERL